MAAPHPTTEQILAALLDGNNDLFLLDNLVATGEAIINVAYLSNMSDDARNVVFQLEKRFRMYAELMQGEYRVNESN